MDFDLKGAGDCSFFVSRVRKEGGNGNGSGGGSNEDAGFYVVEVSKEVEAGGVEKTYHHGRCDVGSPFATGKLFDLEDE